MPPLPPSASVACSGTALAFYDSVDWGVLSYKIRGKRVSDGTIDKTYKEVCAGMLHFV
jgi:hypothetical protein